MNNSTHGSGFSKIYESHFNFKHLLAASVYIVLAAILEGWEGCYGGRGPNPRLCKLVAALLMGLVNRSAANIFGKNDIKKVSNRLQTFAVTSFDMFHHSRYEIRPYS